MGDIQGAFYFNLSRSKHSLYLSRVLVSYLENLYLNHFHNITCKILKLKEEAPLTMQEVCYQQVVSNLATQSDWCKVRMPQKMSISYINTGSSKNTRI